MLHIPALWHFGTSVTYPPWFRRVKLVVIPPCFVYQQYLWNIPIQQAVVCYNPWANLRCSGCYPLGEKLLWNRSIESVPSRLHGDWSVLPSPWGLLHWCWGSHIVPVPMKQPWSIWMKRSGREIMWIHWDHNVTQKTKHIQGYAVISCV